MSVEAKISKKKMSMQEYISTILADYRLITEVRESGAQGRRDVLSGKGSFGIFGDGKELAQIAMAKVFRNGDFRAGYYRDQAFMTAIGQYSSKHMFSSLYGVGRYCLGAASFFLPLTLVVITNPEIRMIPKNINSLIL